MIILMSCLFDLLQIRSLENKVSNLEGDLVTSQREVWSQQSDFKKVRFLL